LPSGIERNMENLLDLLRVHEVKATFFVLGWVADRHPEVVRMIDREGHEIGTHGYHHDLITEMTPAEFEDDLLRSLEAISRHTSQRIRGHRASNFSVVSSTLWALEILARHGLQYDSSVFPITRKRYGIGNWPNRNPHTLKLAGGRSLVELPMSTMEVAHKRVAVAGGGYLRLYPSQVTERFVAQQNMRGLPAMVYLHPWELDVEQTRRNLGMMESFQHYVNLDTTEWKLNRLLQRFTFGPVSETLKLPHLQAMLRRNPVTVPEQSPDAGHKAAAPFVHRADVNAEAAPAPQTAPLAKVTWPLQIGPTVDWNHGRRSEEAHAAAQAGANSNRENLRGFSNEAPGEARLLEDLETVAQEA
jgi:polysaccharide deacetylase family protein (PEP-CTERM system associated)